MNYTTRFNTEIGKTILTEYDIQTVSVNQGFIFNIIILYPHCVSCVISLSRPKVYKTLKYWS